MPYHQTTGQAKRRTDQSIAGITSSAAKSRPSVNVIQRLPQPVDPLQTGFQSRYRDSVAQDIEFKKLKDSQFILKGLVISWDGMAYRNLKNEVVNLATINAMPEQDADVLDVSMGEIGHLQNAAGPFTRIRSMNASPCVIVSMHDTQTRQTMLAHVHRKNRVNDFLQAAQDKFGENNGHLQVHVTTRKFEDAQHPHRQLEEQQQQEAIIAMIKGNIENYLFMVEGDDIHIDITHENAMIDAATGAVTTPGDDSIDANRGYLGMKRAMHTERGWGQQVADNSKGFEPLRTDNIMPQDAAAMQFRKKENNSSTRRPVQRVINYNATSIPGHVLTNFIQLIQQYAYPNLIDAFQNKAGYSLTIQDEALSDNAAHLGMTLVGLDLGIGAGNTVAAVAGNRLIMPQQVPANTNVRLKGLRVTVSLFINKKKIEFALQHGTGMLVKVAPGDTEGVDAQAAVSTLFHEFNRHVAPNYEAYNELKREYGDREVTFGALEAAFTGKTDTGREHASSALVTDQVITVVKYIKDKNLSANSRRKLLFTTALDMFIHGITLNDIIVRYMKRLQHSEGYDAIFSEMSEYFQKLTAATPAPEKIAGTGIHAADDVLITNGECRGLQGKVVNEETKQVGEQEAAFTRYMYTINVNGQVDTYRNTEFMVI
jgi:hypothetical protein